MQLDMDPSVLCGECRRTLNEPYTFEAHARASVSFGRSVRNSLTGGRSALKKIPNVFSSLLSAIRTYREVRMLCELSHDNVSRKKAVRKRDEGAVFNRTT